MVSGAVSASHSASAICGGFIAFRPVSREPLVIEIEPS
jgi:hypothetical protein